MATVVLLISSLIFFASLVVTSEAAPQQRAPRLRRKFITPADASATDFTTMGVLTGVTSSSLTPSLVATVASVAELATVDNKIIVAALVDAGKTARLPGIPRLRRKLSTPRAVVTNECTTKSCNNGDQISSSTPPWVATDLQLPKSTSSMSPFASSSETQKYIFYENSPSQESSASTVRLVGEQQGTMNGTVSDDGALETIEVEQTYGAKLGSGTTEATTILLSETNTLMDEPLTIHRRTTEKTLLTSRPNLRPHPK